MVESVNIHMLFIGTALVLIVYANYWSSGSHDELGKKNLKDPWAHSQIVAFSRSRVGQGRSLARQTSKVWKR